MTTPVLSVQAARNLHLAAQGLLYQPRKQVGPQAIHDTFSRISLLQIDTINIVARSPYLVLFSRLGCYPPERRGLARVRGDLIEYWAHKACFLPKHDFKLIRHQVLNPESMGWKYHPEWMKQHAEDIDQLLQHIEHHGPVRSADSYRLGCYAPAEKRQNGYFVLPLLHKRALVGRLDTKMHRKQGILEIINLYPEVGTKVTVGLLSGLKKALTTFAQWQSASHIRLSSVSEKFRAVWGEGWEIALNSDTRHT